MMQASSQSDRELSTNEIELLSKQNTRLVPEFRAKKFEKESKKHWDIFYKRNTTKFFKDRHWTTREFKDLSMIGEQTNKVLLEVGCGVGNFVFPLLEEFPNLFIYACDFSPRAVDLVKENSLYNEARIKAFQCDITNKIPDDVTNVNVISMIFVLSAIVPELHLHVLKNLYNILDLNGRVLFRDYAINDNAMIRFKPGTKIADKLYLRQDGTTSYFFSLNEFKNVAVKAGFQVQIIEYVHRSTINVKEDVNVERIFLQAVLEKN